MIMLATPEVTLADGDTDVVLDQSGAKTGDRAFNTPAQSAHQRQAGYRP